MPGSLEGPHVTLQSDVHKKPFEEMNGFFHERQSFLPTSLAERYIWSTSSWPAQQLGH